MNKQSSSLSGMQLSSINEGTQKESSDSESSEETKKVESESEDEEEKDNDDGDDGETIVDPFQIDRKRQNS